MGKRNRRVKGQVDPDVARVRKPSTPVNNPFGGLSELRSELPPGARPTLTIAEPKRPPTGLEGCDKVVIQRETKGRAGKTVTRIKGLPPEQLARLAKKLKGELGCGAAREGDDLVVLGSLVERTKAWLEREGAKQVVLSGASDSARRPKGEERSVSPQPTAKERDGRHREHLEPGLFVDVVLKQDQPTGALTRGVVESVLTKSAFHPHGIKVRLTDGQVGRVKVIYEV